LTFEHVFADLGGIPANRLTDPQGLAGLVLAAANAAGLNPANPPVVTLGPRGVSAALVCHGGHVAMHGLPEAGLCFADVAGVSGALPQRGLDVIIKRLGAREVRTDARRRGPVTQPSTRGFMNALTPYAAFFMRLAVGGVFLLHGVSKFQRGIPATAAFLHDVGFPFAIVFRRYPHRRGDHRAACVVLGIFTRFWALCMALEMIIAILAVKLPHGGNIELEGLLFAGAITLVALGDGRCRLQ